MNAGAEDLIDAPRSVPITGALVAQPAPAHPSWPHTHTSREGEILKAIWITAVLLGALIYGLVSAGRNWTRRHRAALERKRTGRRHQARRVS